MRAATTAIFKFLFGPQSTHMDHHCAMVKQLTKADLDIFKIES